LGYIVVTVDLRGTGKSEAKPNKKRNFGYREMLNYDWPVVLDKVNRHFPDKDIYLMGHSLGGQLNVLYAAKHKNLVKGLILTAACTVHYKAWKFPYNLGVLFGTQAGRLLVKILGYFPGKKVGFAGTEAKNVILDWAYTGRTGKYKPLGDDFDYESNFKNIELPVLAISFENDKLAPRKAVEELTGKLSHAKIEHIHFENNKYDHFNWVKQNTELVIKIDDWIKQL
jgi:predicted alpha/beta hydrolase